MNNNLTSLGLLLLSSLLGCVASSSTTSVTVNIVEPMQEKTRVIIKYKDGGREQVQALMEQTEGGLQAFSNGEKVRSIPELGLMLSQISPSLKDELDKNDNVERIELDVIRRMETASNFSSADNPLQQGEMPYGISKVQAPEVWARGARGQGIKVCVIDSGIDGSHPNFDQSTLSGETQGNPNFDDWDEDWCGHGTHVSGTVGATGNTPDDVIGVAPEASIFMVRLGTDNCAFMSSYDLIAAALTCRDNDARVISMSLSGPSSQTEQEALEMLFNDYDILSVAAAGNGGPGGGYRYPASYPVVVSVAATDMDDNRGNWSQVNDQVDLAAPGVGILSTLPQYGCDMCRGGARVFGYSDGTSMSCPHVAGVAALLFSAAPTASAMVVRNSMQDSALDLGAQGRDDQYGNGLVQAASALDTLLPDSGCSSCSTDVCNDSSRCLYQNCQEIAGSFYCTELRTGQDNFCAWSVGTWKCSSCEDKPDGQSCCRRCTHGETPPPTTSPTATPTTPLSPSPSGPPSPSPTQSPSTPTAVPTLNPTSTPTQQPTQPPTQQPTQTGCKACDEDICAGDRCLYNLCERGDDGWWYCDEAREDDPTNTSTQPVCQWNTGTWRCRSCNNQGNTNQCCQGCSAVESAAVESAPEGFLGLGGSLVFGLGMP